MTKKMDRREFARLSLAGGVGLSVMSVGDLLGAETFRDHDLDGFRFLFRQPDQRFQGQHVPPEAVDAGLQFSIEAGRLGEDTKDHGISDDSLSLEDSSDLHPGLT